MKVPFLDLNAQHAPMRAELSAAIEDVMDSGQFAGGPFVTRFEKDFADFCGVAHTVGVGSGTDALWLAMVALGIGPGDEVITVPMTFFATAEAISRTGATPVFVDIEEETYTMDPEGIAKAVTPSTKAILPVHLFGQMADMGSILEIAARLGLLVIEDAAQAHGAIWNGSRAGSLGHAGCFSFYPGKNLGACGEAGAIVTNDADLARKVRMLADHGQPRKYQHTMIGWNCRMDGMQAAILQAKLRNLDKNNRRRREIAGRYSEAFAGLAGVVLPMAAVAETSVHHIYPVRVRDRGQFVSTLEQGGVATSIHYPIPIHLQRAYSARSLGPGSFPVAERCAGEFVSLPIYPEMNDCQIETVIESVKSAVETGLPFLD